MDLEFKPRRVRTRNSYLISLFTVFKEEIVMQTFKNQAAQGDCLITRVATIPEGFVIDSQKDSNYVVAHSETGHNHVMESKDIDFYTSANDPLMIYLVVNKATPVRHLRSFDTHEPLSVPPGIFRINRQRESIPEGFRKAQD